MNWSDKAWERALPVFNAITQMPFIKELMAGTLAMDRFRFYISQDAVYLEHFSKALALIGARAADIQDALAFIRFAEGAIVVEQALHQSYFRLYDVVHKAGAEPACHHYINCLKSTAALDPVEVSMAAVLPCFRVYKEVGDYILKHQQPLDNPYRQWIDTYSGAAFAQLVQQAIDICDRIAAQATPAQREAMTEAYLAASRLEYHFWDSAYQLRTWESEIPGTSAQYPVV